MIDFAFEVQECKMSKSTSFLYLATAGKQHLAKKVNCAYASQLISQSQEHNYMC